MLRGNDVSGPCRWERLIRKASLRVEVVVLVFVCCWLVAVVADLD